MRYEAKIWQLGKDEQGPVIKIRQITRYKLTDEGNMKYDKHISMQQFSEIMEGFDLVLIPKVR